MAHNNDKKILKVYNIMLLINIILITAVTLVMVFAIPFSGIKTKIFVTVGVLAGLILILSLVDILIIKKYVKKYKVM